MSDNQPFTVKIREQFQQHPKLYIVVAVAIVALLTLGSVMRSRSDRPNYLTAGIEQGSITSVVEATGTINPLTTVLVGSYVSGTVKHIFADFNSRVHAGQVLAQLDPEVYQAQVVQARGNLDNAVANQKNLESSITAQEVAIKTNQANLERLKAAASGTIGVVNAATDEFVADISIEGAGVHSVAVNTRNNHIFVPVYGKGILVVVPSK